MPTPLAVLNGAELFSEVIGSELVVVDIGGATTDVVSIGTGRPTRSNVVLRGLREPHAKRTVEADIGMRYSVKGIGRTLENPGIGLQQWIERVSSDINVTPQTPAEKEFDMTLAAQAVSVSVERHCGHLREEYTPQGRVYVQEGKDLTDVGWLIGTGGVIKELSESRRVFSGLAQNSTGLTLMPADPDILCDKSYIFCAMGLLSTREPACAAVILKKEFDL
jgi:uncharacterized protein (TIGR01319 family)